MSTVCALVVTRDRKRLLVECLRALLAQTHPVSAVVVLDNASGDGTEECLRATGLLSSPALRFVRSEVNSGGAGGYADGLRVCLETEWDWIWLMDDDAEPRCDALERLLRSSPAAEPDTAAVCTSVQHPDGAIDRLHRCRMHHFITPLPASAYAPDARALVDCASFVGLLVRGAVAREVGPPRREFFLGYDDAEYSLRVRERGDIRLVPESVIVHKIVIGGGTLTRRSRVFNRLLRQQYTSAPWETYWRDLYRVRNFMALRRERDHISPVALVTLTVGYAAKSLMYDTRPLRRLPWIVRYALKGWRGDFDGVSPEQWAAYASGAR